MVSGDTGVKSDRVVGEGCKGVITGWRGKDKCMGMEHLRAEREQLVWGCLHLEA